MRAERQPGQLRNFLRSSFREFRMRVESGADRRAANRKIVEPIERNSDARAVPIELRNPTRKFLADREGSRVLQMRPADFDNVLEFLSLRLNCITDFLYRRQQH